MPISTYNADGTVDIYNKKTGEVRRGVKPEELVTISPNLVAEYESGRAARESTQITTGAIQSGIIKPDASTSPEVLKQLQETGYKYVDPEEKAKQESGKDLRRDAIKSIDRILGDRTKGMTGTVQLGAKVPILATDTKTTLGEYEKLRSLLSLENIKYLKGTGQISDREGMILEKAALSIPADRRISDDDFREILARTREELSADFTEEEKQTLGTPQQAMKKKDLYNTLFPEGGRKSLDNAISDALSGETPRDITLKDTIIDWAMTQGDYFKDISTHFVLKGKTYDKLNKTLEDNMNLAQRALERAEQEQDPETKKRLQAVANDMMDNVIDARTDIANSFSEDIDVPYWLRGFMVGSDLVSKATMALGAKDLAVAGAKEIGKTTAKTTAKSAAKETTTSLTKKPSLTARILETQKKYSPSRWLSNKQTEEAAKITTKVNTKELLQPLQEAAKLDPDIAKGLQKYGPNIKNIKTAEDLVKALEQFGDIAFTKGGDIASSTKSKIFFQLWKGGIEQLKTIAPEAYKYRQLLAYTFQLPKTTGRLLFRIFLGKGILGGF